MTSGDSRRFIYHITTLAAWESNQPADYVDRSLETDGFIHCSTIAQLLIPANERFSDRRDLTLLKIEAASLSAPLVYEDCYKSGYAFPHVYGAIDRDAVTDLIAFPSSEDGSFALPPDLLG